MKGRVIVGFIVSCLILCGLFTPAFVYAGNTPTQLIINPTQAVADGSSVSVVKITLEDSNNAGVPNDNVTVYSSDSTARFNSNTNIQTNLDGNGSLTFNMTSTDAGDINVTVQDTTTNTTLSRSVHFDSPGGPTSTPTSTPTPAPGTCTDAAPGSTVQLTAAQSSGAHSITLTWTDASNPVTYYLLSYGLSSGHYIYGVPNMGGQGTTSFTVGGLATGTKYYFVIRAGNGCTPGTFSNEISAVAGAAATPTPSSVDTSTDTNQSDLVPTDTPEASADTPTPTPGEAITPVPAIAGPKSSISYIMIGATALGVICAVVGAYLLIRMKKKQRF